MLTGVGVLLGAARMFQLLPRPPEKPNPELHRGSILEGHVRKRDCKKNIDAVVVITYGAHYMRKTKRDTDSHTRLSEKRTRMEHDTTHPSRTVQMVPSAHVERLLRGRARTFLTRSHLRSCRPCRRLRRRPRCLTRSAVRSRQGGRRAQQGGSWLPCRGQAHRRVCNNCILLFVA
jgi:hypothetical protein